MPRTHVRLLPAMAVLLTLVGAAQGQAASANQNQKTLAVVSYGGGTYQGSHKKAFIDPFCAQQKAACQSVVWNAEYGRLAQMVRSGRVTWDVVEVTAAQFARGKREGLFARLARLPDSNTFRALERGPAAEMFGVPNVYWSTALGYRSDWQTGGQPSTWSDFWDTTRHPGPRALHDGPRGNLEFALLADGVAIDHLYPLDVDRAFRKLDAIRPHIRVWWGDGTEPVNLLLTRQVIMTSLWTGRVFASRAAKAEIRFSWAGAAHELDYWIVPKGSPAVLLASEFITFASGPAAMARQAEFTAYGPSNALALANVDKAVLGDLPTAPANWRISFVIDSDWWAANEQQMAARWAAWKNVGTRR